MSRLVIKFGGTSVGSADAIRQAATIAHDLRAAGHSVVVVTSAMSGVTDLLLAGAQAAAGSALGKFLEIASSIRRKHVDAAQILFPDASLRTRALEPIEQRLNELSRLAEALAVLGEASPRALDAVAALGERMSIHLLARAIEGLGSAAVPVEATTFVRTDGV
ncbi:MAG: hypothetical protein MUF60_00760, partial [Vicinamibacterales bacterium]|nr:hypothetical protein [Vicinamibacterales bacterium]